VITLPSGDIPTEALALADKKGIDLSFYLVKANGPDMNEIADMLNQGIIKTTIAEEFSFEEMKEAHSKVESGRSQGKVVVSLA